MLAPIAQFVIDNWSVIQPIIIAVAIAIGTYIVAMNAASIATNLFSIVTNTAKAAMAGFNAVMAMNPIMLIVMASHHSYRTFLCFSRIGLTILLVQPYQLQESS